MTRVNDNRLTANAIEAAEQTERLDIAEIRNFAPLNDVLAAVPEDRLLVWCDEASATKGDRNAVAVFAAHTKPKICGHSDWPRGGIFRE